MAEGFLKVTVQNPLFTTGIGGQQTLSLIHNESGFWDLKSPSVNAYMTAIYFTDGSEDWWEITPSEFNTYPTESWGFRLYTNGENYIEVECVSMSAYGKEIIIAPLWSENILYVNPNGGVGGGATGNPYEVVLHYGSTYTLPTLTKSGYRYTGWNVTKNDDLRPADGKYNSSSKVFTQGYGIYTATAQFIVDSGEDPIAGSYIHVSPTYKEASGTTAGGANYRAAFGYDIDETDDNVIISWNAYVQMHTNYQWGVGVDCEGKTATGALVNSPGTTFKHVASITNQVTTIAKQSTPTTKTFTIKAYGVNAKGNTNNTTYGKAPGSVTLTVTVDIPAKASQSTFKIYGCNGSPISCSIKGGSSEILSLKSEILPLEQFYVIERINMYLTDNDYAFGNIIDSIEIDGESKAEDRILFSYNYDSSNNNLRLIADTEDRNLILEITWMPPIVGGNQNIYIYPEEGKIYARNFIVSDSFYLDNDGTIYAPSFNNENMLTIDESGITAKYFIMGLPD